MKLQEVTIRKISHPTKGGISINFNVDLDDRPFGQIWTWKVRGEVHPYHVKTLAGFYGQFQSYEAAETAIRGEM